MMPADIKILSRPRGMRLEIFQDVAGSYRWRKVARNGQKVSVSGEGFRKHAYAIKAARREHPNLPLFDFTVGHGRS